MVRFLSDGWVAALNEAAASSRELAQATAGTRLSVQQIVRRGPGDDVAYVVRIDCGTVSVAPGRDPAADVTVSEDLDTAAAVARGELNPQVAFLTGRVRVSGDVGRLVAEYEALAGLEDVFAPVRAATSYGD